MRVIFHREAPRLDGQSDGFDQLVVPYSPDFALKDDLGKLVYARAAARWEAARDALRAQTPGSACAAEGCGIARDSLIIATLPDGRGVEDLGEIVRCFCNCLETAGRLRDGIRRTSVAFSLRTVAPLGWSEDRAMHALWRALLEYREAHPRFREASILDAVHIYHSFGCGAASIYRRRVSQAFFAAPDVWGSEGDPYLWLHLMRRFDDEKYVGIDLRWFIDEVRRAVEEVCRAPLSPGMRASAEALERGGAPGEVCGAFWTGYGIPLLCHTLFALGLDNEPAAKIAVDAQFCWEKGAHRLKLPFRILGDLQALQIPRQIVGIEYDRTGAFGHRYIVEADRCCFVYTPILSCAEVHIGGMGARWRATFSRDEEDRDSERIRFEGMDAGIVDPQTRAVVSDERTGKEVFRLTTTYHDHYLIEWRDGDRPVSVRRVNGDVCFFGSRERMLARIERAGGDESPDRPFVDPELYNPDDERIICTIDLFEETDSRLILAICAFNMLASIMKSL